MLGGDAVQVLTLLVQYRKYEVITEWFDIPVPAGVTNFLFSRLYKTVDPDQIVHITSCGICSNQ